MIEMWNKTTALVVVVNNWWIVPLCCSHILADTVQRTSGSTAHWTLLHVITFTAQTDLHCVCWNRASCALCKYHTEQHRLLHRKHRCMKCNPWERASGVSRDGVTFGSISDIELQRSQRTPLTRGVICLSVFSLHQYMQTWRPVWERSWCYYSMQIEQISDSLVLTIPRAGRYYEGPYRCVSDAENVTAPDNSSQVLAIKVHCECPGVMWVTAVSGNNDSVTLFFPLIKKP